MSNDERDEVISYIAAAAIESEKKLSILIGFLAVIIIAELIQIVLLLLM